MKADEPETDILETLRKLVKRVEELELENRLLKKENERLKKRIEELERKNKRYVAPHSRETTKEDPKPRLGQSGTPRGPVRQVDVQARELSATNKAPKMKTSRLSSQWISPIFAPNARLPYCSSLTKWIWHSSPNSPK